MSTTDSANLLSALGQAYAQNILRITDEELTAKQISAETGIPIATCYRRIEDLVEGGLLEETDQILTDDHRRASVYRRSVDSIECTFVDQSIQIETEERQVKLKIDQLWNGITSS